MTIEEIKKLIEKTEKNINDMKELIEVQNSIIKVVNNHNIIK